MKQHKQIGVRDLRVKTGVKAGSVPGDGPQHNETLVRGLPKVRDKRVKSGVKAGLNVVNFPFGLER
jgi:hypothetical protein